MKRAHFILVIGFAAATCAACRVAGDDREFEAETLLPSQVASEPPPPVARPAADPAPKMLKGFDLAGEASCLPLDAARRCIELKTPVKGACETKKGEVLRCEDCRPLCSVALK